VGYLTVLYALVLISLHLLRGIPVNAEDYLVIFPWWANLIVLAIIALTLLPVHRWLQGNVNAIIYGEHDDPYLMISTINYQLQAMISPQLTLPNLAETISHTLKVPYVTISTIINNAPQRYEVGVRPRHAELLSLPLLYLDKALGELSVSSRRANEPLSQDDVELLQDVARQIGIALQTLQLTADLQASRERLVISREEERRRIRNDLHDGLGPTLSSLQLQLGAMHNLIRQRPEEAEAIALSMRQDLRQATAEIRQLVYDLRPPMLDELGLVEAIKSVRVQEAVVNLEVIAPEPMPRLSAAMEVAIYRIASEAIHNVIRHSQATICTLCLEVSDTTLKLVVTDNGKGLPEAPNAGVGFNSMKERAAELGGTLSILPTEDGGVKVTAQFPLVG
jgi:signal transduction histidine kinase